VHDDTLSHHEFDTEPFTATELAAIMDYRTTTEGIADAIMETTPAEMGAAAKAFGPTAARNLLDDHCDALNTWFLALDQALAEMLTCTTESTTYSTAAARFLKAEAAAYHRARQHFEHTTTVFLLSRDTTPLAGNYPRFTSSLNLPMQCLEGEG
jgi:hypothetical protein